MSLPEALFSKRHFTRHERDGAVIQREPATVSSMTAGERKPAGNDWEETKQVLSSTGHPPASGGWHPAGEWGGAQVFRSTKATQWRRGPSPPATLASSTWDFDEVKRYLTVPNWRHSAHRTIIVPARDLDANAQSAERQTSSTRPRPCSATRKCPDANGRMV